MNKIRVLVVDDSAVVRAVVIKTLRLTGLEWGDIHQAGNGKEAFKLVEEANPDLILLDLRLPELNLSAELAQRIKAMHAAREAEQVAVQASAARAPTLQICRISSPAR